jgi:phage tail tube protein FII
MVISLAPIGRFKKPFKRRKAAKNKGEYEMTTYKHQSTEATIELLEDKGMAVIVKAIDTGEIKEINKATFRRWWAAVEAENADSEQTAAALELDGANKDAAGDGQEIQGENSDIESAKSESYAAQDADDNSGYVDGKPQALSEVISKLEGLFDMLNGIYFKNALPRPIITVQSTPRAYGHCSIHKIWDSGVENIGEAYYEINIGAEYLSRPSEDTAATMCHEMVHLFCRENGLTETCQNGRYHNKLFKAGAENCDLQVRYDRSIGYSPTAPTEAFIAKLREAGYALEIPFARHTLAMRKKTAARNKTHRYFCAVCGQEARGAFDLNLICGNCQAQMERAS